MAEDRREWRAGAGAATVILGGAFACWVVLSAPIQVSELTDTVVPAADAASFFTLSAPGANGAGAERSEGAVTPQGIMRPVAEDATPLASGDITKVQQRLKSLGFDPGKADGAAGPRTLTALNAYRKSLGLAPVTQVDRQAVAPLLP
ncbi:MAG TPA: peptidoglycan-binding domain-containing protein [Dongiaceae bacterium]